MERMISMPLGVVVERRAIGVGLGHELQALGIAGEIAGERAGVAVVGDLAACGITLSYELRSKFFRI